MDALHLLADASYHRWIIETQRALRTFNNNEVEYLRMMTPQQAFSIYARMMPGKNYLEIIVAIEERKRALGLNFDKNLCSLSSLKLNQL